MVEEYPGGDPFFSLPNEFQGFLGDNDIFLIGNYTNYEPQRVKGITMRSWFVNTDENSSVSADTKYLDGFSLNFGNENDFTLLHDGTDSRIKSSIPGGKIFIEARETGGSTTPALTIVPDGSMLLIGAYTISNGGTGGISIETNGDVHLSARLEMNGNIDLNGKCIGSGDSYGLKFSGANGIFTNTLTVQGILNADGGIDCTGALAAWDITGNKGTFGNTIYANNSGYSKYSIITAGRCKIQGELEMVTGDVDDGSGISLGTTYIGRNGNALSFDSSENAVFAHNVVALNGSVMASSFGGTSADIVQSIVVSNGYMKAKDYKSWDGTTGKSETVVLANTASMTFKNGLYVSSTAA